MTNRDYLTIGLKLMGVYFAVLGITILVVSLSNFLGSLAPSDLPNDYGSGLTYELIRLMQPIAYLACAFHLVRRTEWCLTLMGIPEDR